MSENSGHIIISLSGRWGYLGQNATRISKLFESRREAVKHGRAIARRDGITLYIHNKDGSVRSVVEPPKRAAKK